MTQQHGGGGSTASHLVSLLSPPTSSWRLTEPLPSESKSMNRFKANSCTEATDSSTSDMHAML